MKVAVIVGSLTRSAGGLFNSVRMSSHYLLRQGVDVEVFGFERVDVASDLDAWLPIVPKPLGSSLRSVASRVGIPGALDDGKYDVVHQHGIWQPFSLNTRAWGKRNDRPVVVSPRGMLDAWAMQNSAWKKRIAMRLFEGSNLRNASCLHALNTSEMDTMRELGLDNPVAIIPNGVAPNEKDSMIKRPSAYLRDGRRKLLFLGRIHPKKGLNETLEGWAGAQQIDESLAKDWVLVIAGWDDGGHLNDLQRKADSLGLSGSVIFQGPAFGADKESILCHSDAFILASHSEGLPMSVLEAWSHGLPVLMTPECNLPEAFDVGAAIKISTDPVEIARKISTSLSDPGLSSYGETGMALVASKFTWKKISRDFASLYGWLAGASEKPDFVVT